MKAHFYIIFLVVTFLSACSIFNSDNDVKEGHFRIANHVSDIPTKSAVAYLYVMCNEQRPVSWVSKREYPSGQQNLLVKATFHKTNKPSLSLEAYVNFDMNFLEGESYQLMYDLLDENISVWLQSSQSSEPISNIITTPLKRQNINDSQMRLEHCRSSSV